MNVEIFADSVSLAQAGARFVATAARSAIAARGQFVLALSGGQTPWDMLGALVHEDVHWPAVHVVQVDERVAPDGATDRNLTQLLATPIGQLCGARIHAMPVLAPNLDQAARDYANLLERLAGSPPILDLVHLGLGADGHTASLFPDDPLLTVVDADVGLSGVQLGRRRMTLTYPILNRSRQILWMISGSGKSDMVQHLCEGDTRIPAGRIKNERIQLYLDVAAAARLNVNRS